MKLSFRAKYLSIDKFNEVVSGDFMVLTGVNGSGKSHLLEAIEQKKITVDGGDPLQVVRFNFETFRLENESAYNGQQISAERDAAWKFMQQQIRPHAANFRTAIGPSYAGLKEDCQKSKKPLWSEDAVAPYKQQVTQFFSQPQIKGHQAAIGVYSLIQQLPYGIDEIKQEDFVSLYKPYSAKQDFLPMALGKVIWDYYLKYRNNQFNQFENQCHGKNYPVLTDAEFIAAHGEKPWEVINSILQTFSSLEYRINSPEGKDYFGNFVLKLVHTTKPGLEVEFSALSSGERVLMALVASVYKSSSDNYFPNMLLLDELDASLHPSMMKNMLSVIQDVFLKRGVKVVLVSHSPTTIALAPEDAIYVMNRTGPNRIEKRSKNEALAILTEGFATLEEGIVLFDEVAKNKLSIFTEGNNASYIVKALDFAGLSGDVSVVKGVESITGKSQLRTLFEFFSRVPHSNKVLFVWDCDATYNLAESDNTHAFIFSANSTNTLAKAGIENLLPDSLFTGFIKTITRSSGAVIREFDDSRKGDFATHVQSIAKKADFSRFDPLIDKVRSLLAR